MFSTTAYRSSWFEMAKGLFGRIRQVSNPLNLI